MPYLPFLIFLRTTQVVLILLRSERPMQMMTASWLNTCSWSAYVIVEIRAKYRSRRRGRGLESNTASTSGRGYRDNTSDLRWRTTTTAGTSVSSSLDRGRPPKQTLIHANFLVSTHCPAEEVFRRPATPLVQQACPGPASAILPPTTGQFHRRPEPPGPRRPY